MEKWNWNTLSLVWGFFQVTYLSGSSKEVFLSNLTICLSFFENNIKNEMKLIKSYIKTKHNRRQEISEKLRQKWSLFYNTRTGLAFLLKFLIILYDVKILMSDFYLKSQKIGKTVMNTETEFTGFWQLQVWLRPHTTPATSPAQPQSHLWCFLHAEDPRLPSQ